MNLAYKKILGKFTKVLGFGKTPPQCWEKFPNNIVFFFRAYLSFESSKEKARGGADAQDGLLPVHALVVVTSWQNHVGKRQEVVRAREQDAGVGSQEGGVDGGF